MRHFLHEFVALAATGMAAKTHGVCMSYPVHRPTLQSRTEPATGRHLNSPSAGCGQSEKLNSSTAGAAVTISIGLRAQPAPSFLCFSWLPLFSACWRLSGSNSRVSERNCLLVLQKRHFFGRMRFQPMNTGWKPVLRKIQRRVCK